MNPSYLRIQLPLGEVMARYGRWIGTPEIEPPRLVGDRQAIDLALETVTGVVLRFTSTPRVLGRCSKSSRAGWRRGQRKSG
jgi:hypothetical protein